MFEPRSLRRARYVSIHQHLEARPAREACIVYCLMRFPAWLYMLHYIASLVRTDVHPLLSCPGARCTATSLNDYHSSDRFAMQHISCPSLVFRTDTWVYILGAFTRCSKRALAANPLIERGRDRCVVQEAIEIHPDLLYFWVTRRGESGRVASSSSLVLHIDNELKYEPFANDFGPLHLGSTYRFCRKLSFLLKVCDMPLLRAPNVSGPLFMVVCSFCAQIRCSLQASNRQLCRKVPGNQSQSSSSQAATHIERVTQLFCWVHGSSYLKTIQGNKHTVPSKEQSLSHPSVMPPVGTVSLV